MALNVSTFEYELRIHLTKEMGDDIIQLAKYTGMDMTNLTRMALVEFIENHKDKLKHKGKRQGNSCRR